MRPLENIRILDLSRLLPGPYATLLLADLGAEVIKVESPGVGDYLRMLPPFIQDAQGADVGATFALINRNKQSVALNYRNKRGKEIFLRLVREADVVVESFRAGAAEKWGIGYAALRAINPRLVYCSLSGYGQTGAYKDRAGHDLNYIALAGLLAANGEPERAPIPPAVQIADLSGAMLAAMAILAALLGRAQTGEGQYLDMSLFEGALAWAGTIIGGTHAAGAPVVRGKMQLNGGMACYNVYETRDGEYLTLAAIEPHFWATFCQTVERPDLLPRQQDMAAIPQVAAIFKTRTRAEWLALFEKRDACIEPVRDFAQLLDDPHVQDRGLVANIGGVRQIGNVFAFADKTYTPAPRQGEHTRAVLQRLGMSAAELSELEQAGVIKILN